MGQSHSTPSGNKMKNYKFEYTTSMQNGRVEEKPSMDPSVNARSIMSEKFDSTSEQCNYYNETNRNYHHRKASLSSLFRNRTLKLRRTRSQRDKNVSASFNVTHNMFKVDLVNVNTASEEELMTLQGINRALARNIVNHRHIIQRFNKIEDLALVSGMGANKLEGIRHEICINSNSSYKRNKMNSRLNSTGATTPSKSPSLTSLPSTNWSMHTATTHRSYYNKLVNINHGNVFDLMSVGLDQALAARIVNYRDRKGPFHHIDDLRRIKGLHWKRLDGGVKTMLTVEDLSDETTSNSLSSNTVEDEEKSTGTRSSGGKSHVRNPSYVSTKLAQLNATLNDTLSQSEMRAIHELLCLKSTRPINSPIFNFSYKSLPAYRIGTWNLDKLTVEKIQNVGVLEVITRTVLENGLSLLAVQEVCDKTALEKICNELNGPSTLPKTKEWQDMTNKNRTSNWKWAMDTSHPVHFNKLSYNLGIVYNAEEIDSVELVGDGDLGALSNPIQNGSLWQFGVFKVKTKRSTWILVNVLSTSTSPSEPIANGVIANGHAPPSSGTHVQEQQTMATSAIETLVSSTDGAIILGHFNPSRAQKGLQNLKELDRIYPVNECNENEVNQENNTTKSSACAEPAASLFMTKGLQELYTGSCNTVTSGLSHLAIPNGSWGIGGTATPHHPLYATMYDLPKLISPLLQDSISSPDTATVAAETITT